MELFNKNRVMAPRSNSQEPFKPKFISAAQSQKPKVPQIPSHMPQPSPGVVTPSQKGEPLVQVAFDPATNKMKSNLELFEERRTKNEQLPMFTALISRDVKQRFDLEYKSYKKQSSELNFVDPDFVKIKME